MKWSVQILAALCCVVASMGAQQAPTSDQLLAKARSVYDEEGAKPALPLFETALQSYRDAGDRRGEAITIGLIGNCYKHLGDTDRALQMLQSSLAIKRELKDPIEQAKTLNNIGLVYWELGKFKDAAGNYASAVQLAGDAGNPQIQAAILNNLGLAHSSLGNYKQAFDEFQRALTLARSANFDRGASDALGNIGGWYLDLGHYNEALQSYLDSTAVAEKAGLKPSVMQNLGNIGLIYTALGRVPDALDAFDRASAMAAEQGLKREEADWHKGKGSALSQLGRYDAAIDEFRKADKMYAESGSSRQRVEVFNDLGDVYLSIGDVASAEKQFDSALTSAARIRYAQGAQTAAISLADIENRRGHTAKSRERLTAALRDVRAAGDDAAAITVLLQLSALERQAKRFAAAHANAASALESARRIGAPLLEARAMGEHGEIALARMDAAASLVHFRAADALAQGLTDSELKWQLAYGEGRALEAAKQWEQAVDAYRRAVEQIESVRDQLREERFRAGYLQTRYDVYIALVRLLVKLHRFDEAFSFSERLRTRSFLELLRRGTFQGSAELVDLRARIRRLQSAILAEESSPQPQQRTFADAYSDELSRAEARYQELLDDQRARQHGLAAERGLTVSSSKEVAARLPADAALLEYVVGRESTSLLCLTRQSLHGTTIPVSGANLTAKVELLRDLVGDATGDEWRGPSASLYQQLIGPAAEAGWLRGVKRLYLVPHGILHYLPFAALQHGSGEGSRFLVEEYSLKYLPSASLLTASPASGSRGSKLLSVAPARARLPYAAQEAESVAQLFSPDSLALLGNTATKARFTQIAGNYDLIHLATHGSFNRLNPMFSGVQLQPEGADDGTLHVFEIVDLQLRARLVTLSACETALGSGFFSDLPPGDEFVGLTRAFLEAGGQSVMATLWEVNDRSTVEFMLNFYRHSGSEENSVALAAAQRTMAAKGPYRHPYYWAAFVLNGVGK